MAKFINFNSNIRHLPKRIILIRHGQSTANVDREVYANTPDHKIPLTAQGIDQAREAGRKILDLVSSPHSRSVTYFYVSPYERAKSTLREILRAFPRNRVAGVREECRLREKDYGCFLSSRSEGKDPMADWDRTEEDCDRYGRFFYRFPNGESGADVYDRVSSFLESLWRDIDMNRLSNDSSAELNVVLVSHEESILVFLMRWFQWSTEQFESLNGPKNCEIRVLELGSSGEYSLAIQHDDETMKAWGLSSEMVDDQKQRATAKRTEKSPWYLNTFLDSVESDNGSHEQEGDQNN